MLYKFSVYGLRRREPKGEQKSNIFFQHHQRELFMYPTLYKQSFTKNIKKGWYKRTISRIKTCKRIKEKLHFSISINRFSFIKKLI